MRSREINKSYREENAKGKKIMQISHSTKPTAKHIDVRSLENGCELGTLKAVI